MRPEAPAPIPVPPGPPPAEPASPSDSAWPPPDAWPPEDDDLERCEQPWPDESEGSSTPWSDEHDATDPAADPWPVGPVGPGVEAPPEEAFPDGEEPTDPAFDLPDERDPRIAPAAGRCILGLREEVGLSGGHTLVALCETGRATSVIAGRLDTSGPAPTLHLRTGTVLPAQPASDGGVLLDLVIAGRSVGAVKLSLADDPDAPDLLLGRDLLAGRFLVDPAGL